MNRCLRVNKTSTRRVEIDSAHAASEFENFEDSAYPYFPTAPGARLYIVDRLAINESLCLPGYGS
jgi:hypothetical protein